MDVQIPCGCPPKADGQPRHDSDTVTLHEPIDPRTRRALLYDVSLLVDATPGDQLAMLSEGYVLRCIDAWTCVDAKGKPLPPSRDNIRERIIADAVSYDTVAKAGDELYSEAVLLPLTLGASSSSPATPTAGSTSQGSNGKAPRTRRSRPSSTSITPMAVTGPMQASSGGGSSS